MSSSSDDDCYGNVANKLESLKRRYRAEKSDQRTERAVNVKCVGSSLDSPNSMQDDSVINLLEEVPNVPGPPIPDKPPAKRGKGCPRKSARLSRSVTAPESATLLPSRGRKKKNAPPPLPVPQAGVNVSEVTSDLAQSASLAVQSCAPSLPSAPRAATAKTPRRGGRAARGGRGSRGRSRGSNRSIWQQLQAAIINSVVYSVGNTDEYPDTAENIPIFSTNNTKNANEVVSIDLSSTTIDDDYDENEELSVKVCWQQTEYIKFNIRKFQKLTQIFEFFSRREGVSADRLLFTLRGRILRAEDTPDSIHYSTTNFIDGGVVTTSVASIAGLSNSNKENAGTGILIKFQCQNSKKPFETHIQPTEKLHTAMVKCAEHLEVPYARLRFLLDGDQLSAASTPDDHALDSGDTIDVNILG